MVIWIAFAAPPASSTRACRCAAKSSAPAPAARCVAAQPTRSPPRSVGLPFSRHGRRPGGLRWSPRTAWRLSGLWSTEARNEPCLLTGGSGSDQLRSGVEVLPDSTLGTVSLSADSLPFNGLSIEGGGRSADLRHPGAEHTVTASETPEPEAEPLTAKLELVSASHSGSRTFEMYLTISEEVALGYAVPPRTRLVHDRPTHP